MRIVSEFRISGSRLRTLRNGLLWCLVPTVLLGRWSAAHGQGGPTGDTTSLKYNISPPKPWEKKKPESNVDLINPVQTEWKYNPKTNRYEEFRSIGGMSVPTGKTMTISDYFKMKSQEAQNQYFRDKTQNNSYDLNKKGKGNITDYVKSELTNPTVSKIFGEGGVDFQLSGSAMVKLGGSMNVNRNPNFSKRQQRYFVPVFDQQLQIAANGKIGQYVKLGINYDTEAAFEFDNQTNLGWKGKPNQILKDVQVGNVSLNLPTQLIKPTNNLFGFATTMQFGKTTYKTVFSQNKGQSTETVLQGGQQLQQFRITADNYDQNRHFFLSQYFRDHYNQNMSTLPVISSGVVINRVEVWVTNRNGNVETPRDILAFMDMGEKNPYNQSLVTTGAPDPANNSANKLYDKIKADPAVRTTGTAIDRVNAMFPDFNQSVDYEILNYARQLSATEYQLDTRLGFISLNQPLNNDEILAVAFEYTYNGQVFQVGEFSRDVPPGDQKLLFLKMLKSNTTRPKLPIWNLMMKNIYTLNTYNLSLDEFKLQVLYADDTSGADYNYLPIKDIPAFANGNPLIRVLGVDKLNRQKEAKPDGNFDALEGYTVQTQYARIIFPETEPFGSYLRQQFGSHTDLADYYCFDSMYRTTKGLAQQDTRHNKFYIAGSYKSPNGAELFLGTTNLQKGSVRVTANGRPLTEGMDYEVDYALGRVKIINQGLLQGGAEIRASADGQSFFNIQQKTLIGGRMEHKFSKKLIVGATALHMYERPLTTKTNFGEEPLLNTILGTDVSFSTKSRFITRLVDKLPFLETKEISSVTGYAEFAKIIPHNHKSQGGQRGISNVEDFENAELPNDYKMVTNWVISSVPQKQPDLFPETQNADKLTWLNHVGSLSYYTIDPLFYRDADMPDNIKANVDNYLSDPYMRQVDQREVFPQRQFPQGTPTILPTLDLVYRPMKRGQYNYNSSAADLDASGNFLSPTKTWAGIMRRVDQNDWEAANIDYIEIWMMDPLIKNPSLSGQFYLNLGSISEDILPDRRKSFENGLPADGKYSSTDTTNFAIVPSTPQVNYAFDNNPESLKKQDVGLDGRDDDQERQDLDTAYLQKILTNFGPNSTFYQEAKLDPSNDNFLHYLESTWDQPGGHIIQRYSRYQGQQNNSNPDKFSGKYSGMPKSNSPSPNDEDVNKDFTMNQSEDYFQYKINISANDLQIGKNYVTDIVRNTVNLRNGKTQEIKWYQFKIPIRQYQKIVGNVSDFKSIRFMRMFLTGFNDTTVMRIGYINVVRADWRRYTNSLKNPGIIVPTDPNDGTRFSVSTVNLEENGKRYPISYVTPPGVVRVQNMASLGTVLENEQSLSLQVCDLKPGDSRGAYKTFQLDLRNYKDVQMFIHAEASNNAQIQDGEVTAFIRFGTDLTSNYYEYEIPLKLTRGVVNSATSGHDKLVWPEDNMVDIPFELFYQLKIDRQNANWPMTTPFIKAGGKGQVKVMGLPDVSNIRIVMVGVKNNSPNNQCFETWFNELRVKNIANKGGWAALANMQMKLADFGQLNMAGSIRSIGFGDVDKKLNDRSLSTNMNYDIASNLDLGRFFPKKSGITLPMYIGYSENYIRPKYYPLNPDIEMQTYLSGIFDKTKRNAIRKAAEDYNSLYSINFSNLHLAQPQGKKAKLFSISNFNATYSYQKNFRRNQQIEEFQSRTTMANLGYNYTIATKFIKPFKKLKPKWLYPIKEFNFNFLPSSISTNIKINRYYSETQNRNNNNYRQINPKLYDKNFTMDRMYNFSLPLTSSINIGYRATASSRIEEPFGALDTKEKKIAVRQEFYSLGKPSKFTQDVTGTYKLPFDKFKILDWISSSVTYTGSYGWDQAPPAYTAIGNNIQNARDINATAQLNFQGLYQKIPWLRNLEKPKKSAKKSPEDGKKDGYESALDKSKEEKPKANPAKLAIGNFISMLKNASLTFKQTQGTELPGFSYKPDYFGYNFLHQQPGIPFVFGWQDDNIRYKLASENALNRAAGQPNFFRNNFTQNISGSITVEPIKSFRIQLDFSRAKTNNISSQFRWNDTNWIDQGLTATGSYQVTGIFFKTNFVKDVDDGKNHRNATFAQFKNNRFTTAQLLAQQDQRWNGQYDSTSFPQGYSKNSQDVLVGAFFSSYAGKSPNKTNVNGFPSIPLPNWNVNWNGLTKIKAIGKKFTNINIRHAYTGRYSIAGYTQNLHYDPKESVGKGKDFTPKNQIADVSISEGFFPLIGINLATKNNWTFAFDYKRARTVKLFAASFNITEIRNNDISVQGGYRVQGLLLPFKRHGRRVYLPNDFRFDLNLTFSDNTTCVRRINEDLEQYTAGMKNLQIRPSITYQVNQKINASLKYNRTVMNPKIANQFYTALTDFGLELRYILK